MALEYKKNALEFRSWIDADDVKATEERLISMGVSECIVKNIIQAVGDVLFDIEIYDVTE